MGNTAEDYILQHGKYKKIYVYEPLENYAESCRERLEKYKDVIVKKYSVGEKSSRMMIDVAGLADVDTEQEEIEIVSLDEDIMEKVTFIKMDVAGFGIPAIIGAKNHIRDDSPKLAICIHYVISDLWEIPKLINAINPDYQFYIRNYMESENLAAILYAIPPCCKKKYPKESGRQKKIVAIAPHERGGTNIELIKDCGLIPYLLYKNHGHSVTMVGAEEGPYPYLEYIKGVKMEFLPGSSISEKVRYITDNAGEIDALLIRGCHSANFPVVETYKQANPDGRIYAGLDANSAWMDRIKWDDSEFMKFMDSCDVIATSCLSMQKFLNEKWPWKIEHIPNGWYDFSHQQKEPVFENKKNIILTVGRLGTEQKATEVLLEAFAKITDKIPDWELRLAGGVEESFGAYIKEYFNRFPDLSGKVRFVGMITDRDRILMEYQDAKIFAMSSKVEGGTPNVIAEALHAGCVMAVTRFDAYEEATDYGRCGLSVEKGDADGLAEILYRLCMEKNLKQFSEHAYQYSRRHFDMENITAKVNEMLFGEEGSYENNFL